METAYLFACGLGCATWLACFAVRPDLRRLMLFMSCVGIPLALSDLFYVPRYWRPKTWGHIPVGVEGVLFSFEAAGICAVIYAIVMGNTIVPQLTGVPNLRRLVQPKTLIALIPLPVSTLISIALNTNLEWGLYTGLIVAILATAAVRPDLARPALLGGLAFLPVYTASLVIWVAAYPEVTGWFTLWKMPHWYLLGVPLTEIAFGGLFAAYWTGLYPMVFDARYAEGRGAELSERAAPMPS
ncbi:MAG TPA: hypothetical protein VG815_11160 [Chloroflexota bacterium]|jgi:hypothetical protein|nr:hypothetical protein [Chloroflexota bacterium]